MNSDSVKRCVRLAGSCVAAVGALSCGADRAAGPTTTSGSIALIVDSLQAPGAGGVWLTAPDGTRRYTLVRAGTTLVAAVPAPLGTYRVEFDTVWFGDTGVNALNYDSSRWSANPLALTMRLDPTHAGDTARVVYRQVTGGVLASASGNPDLWFEVLHADGSGCHCTSGGGNGRRGTSAGTSIQNLLPGVYKVHFLTITYFPAHPGGDPTPYTVVPVPDTVVVTVRPGALAPASAVYHVQ